MNLFEGQLNRHSRTPVTRKQCIVATALALAAMFVPSCVPLVTADDQSDDGTNPGSAQRNRLEPRSAPYLICHDDASLTAYKAFLSESYVAEISAFVLDSITEGAWGQMMECLGIKLETTSECSEADVVIRWTDEWPEREMYIDDGVCRPQSSRLGRTERPKPNEPRIILLNALRLAGVPVPHAPLLTGCTSYEPYRFAADLEDDALEGPGADLFWTINHEWGHLLMGFRDFLGNDRNIMSQMFGVGGSGPRALGSLDKDLAIAAFPELLEVVSSSPMCVTTSCDAQISITLHDRCELQLLSEASLNVHTDVGRLPCDRDALGFNEITLECEAELPEGSHTMYLMSELPPKLVDRIVYQWDLTIRSENCSRPSDDAVKAAQRNVDRDMDGWLDSIDPAPDDASQPEDLGSVEKILSHPFVGSALGELHARSLGFVPIATQGPNFLLGYRYAWPGNGVFVATSDHTKEGARVIAGDEFFTQLADGLYRTHLCQPGSQQDCADGEGLAFVRAGASQVAWYSMRQFGCSGGGVQYGLGLAVASVEADTGVLIDRVELYIVIARGPESSCDFPGGDDPGGWQLSTIPRMTRE